MSASAVDERDDERDDAPEDGPVDGDDTAAMTGPAVDDDATTSAFAEPPVKSRRLASTPAGDKGAPSSDPASRDAEEPDEAVLHSHMRGVRMRMGAPIIDRNYRLSEPFATGGMATIHLGVRDGDRRIYAIKRLHAEFAHDEYFAQMLLDEATIAARIRHHNVVPMYGAGIVGTDLILVMEYVSGLTIADLIRTVHPRKLPPRMVTAILGGALRGLHAAHETRDEHGRPLDIVHRDVSPPNVHLGADGVARILDFGVAKAAHRAQTTRIGELKGKLAYMAPEQLDGTPVDRRVDIRAAGVVLWEALAGAPLFHAESDTATMARIVEGNATPPSQVTKGVPPELDAIVLKALAPRREDRFETALAMAEALDAVFADDTPPSHEIAAWLTAIAADTLCKQWNLRSVLLDDVTKATPRRAQMLRVNTPIPNASTRVAPLSETWKRRPDDADLLAAAPPSTAPRARSPAESDPSARVQQARLAVLALAVLIAFFVLVSLLMSTH